MPTYKQELKFYNHVQLQIQLFLSYLLIESTLLLASVNDIFFG